MDTFKDEVFELAKLLSRSDFSRKLKDMRNEISSGELDSGKRLNSKKLFFSSVKEEKTHFYGVLVLNSDIEKNKIDDRLFKKSETFSLEEKELYFQGHFLLVDIFNLLIKKIGFLPISYQLALSPYAGLKEIDSDYLIQTNRVLTLEKYENLVNSFEQMKLVKDIRQKFSEIDPSLYNLNYQRILMMFYKIRDEITKYGFRETTPAMRDISIKRNNGNLNQEDRNLDFFYSLYCLKESVEIALNTFFSSLIGRKMSIINENNIIDVIDDFNTPVKKGKSFLLIDDYTNLNPILGNICLMTYKEKYTEKMIHEFGIINAIQTSFNQELGKTIKISNLLIDDCLNMYYPYTD